ncbi:MAG: GGDEF domain-containing protein [Psychromonas sp.]|nr:GGDEF domain-containing protein [Alteromonadales bacterium]MCP5076599.1 GGDEF domain-containing protein [Psychromonas sp.]
MSNMQLLQQARKKLKNNKANDALVLCNKFIKEVAFRDQEKLHGELLLSEILIELGHGGDSLTSLERAVALFSANTLPDDKLQVLSTLSYRYNDLGLYQIAADKWLKVGEVSAEVGRVDFFIQALLGIGSMLEIVGEHTGALNFFKQAEVISNKSNSALTYARLHFHIVACYISLKKYDKAQKYLMLCRDNDALEIVFELEALVHLYQAKIYRKTGQAKKALVEILQGQEIVRKGVETWTQSMIKLELGKCFIADKQAVEATALLSGVCLKINGVGLDFLDQKLNEALSDAYAQQNLFDEALEHEKVAHEIELSLIGKIPVGKLECEYFAKLAKQQRLLLIQHTQLENKALKDRVEDQHDIVERLKLDVFTDPLTDVYNRRWLDDELNNRKECYALLMIDADHFKTVNDDFSHQVGDHVLKRLASILSSEVRPIDSVTRFGGEEFVVILSETNQLQIAGLAERVRHAVEVAHWSDLLPGRPLTISIGGAVRSNGEPADKLLKRADIALYEAKAKGRNCYRFNEE